MRRRSRVATIAGVWLATSLCAQSGPLAAEADVLGRVSPALRALVVARGDCIVLEYYRKDITPKTRSPVYSVAKSLLSILVGAAVDDGRLRLDDTLGDMLPETKDGAVDPMARGVTVRNLLTMTSGFAPSAGGTAAEPSPGVAWRRLVARPMRSLPGAHFAYDGDSAALLAAILERATRTDLGRFAARVLFRPLQIAGVDWRPNVGLRLTARDMAKIGLLYLQKGAWNGRRIVSEAYVRESTTRQNAGGPPFDAAYGYLWWVGATKDGLPTFFAAGQDGQRIEVVPSLNLVVAVLANGLPDGGRRLLDETVMPLALSSPAAPPCTARLQQEASDVLGPAPPGAHHDNATNSSDRAPR